MAEILVVEDSESIREGVKLLLEGEFHSVRTAGTGPEALDAFARKVPDCVLLDVGLPGRSGFDVCREMRNGEPSLPILMLSARSDESAKVLGLELGADDYMTKPFGANELVARVRALLRRGTRPSAAGVRFRFGTGLVDRHEQAFISRLREHICLSRMELQLLEYFFRHRDEVVSRRRLQDAVWGEGSVCNSRTLDTRICMLRRKIRGCGWAINAVIGEGYRLATGT